MFLTKNLSNTCLKKKPFYKFIKLFEIKNIIKKQKSNKFTSFFTFYC